MDIETRERVAEIRRLNDEFRTRFRGGKILLTSSVAKLPTAIVAAALLRVSNFTEWTPDNDPHGEHDYLSFDLCHREFLFKIDYYDLNMEGVSPDPADPDVTKRVGTLMLSMECPFSGAFPFQGGRPSNPPGAEYGNSSFPEGKPA